MPEEPAEADDGDRGSGRDKGRAGTGHFAILVLYETPESPGIAKLDYQLT
jgi:hypothetical protein